MKSSGERKFYKINAKFKPAFCQYHVGRSFSLNKIKTESILDYGAIEYRDDEIMNSFANNSLLFGNNSYLKSAL